MNTLCDWYSFTVYSGEASVMTADRFDRMCAALYELTSGLIGVSSQPFTMIRRPYNQAAKLNVPGGLILFNATLDYATVELSGQSCAAIGYESLRAIFQMTSTRATRVDLAIDVPTSERPTAIVDAGYSNRIKSRGLQISATGETVYLGAKSGDKYMRVYVYDEGDRAGVVRFEIVSRDARAKTLARLLGGDLSLSKACASVIASFELKTGLLDGLEDAASLPSPERNRDDEKTAQWLMRQARPALARLVESGAVSEDWITSFLAGIALPAAKPF